MSQLDLAGAAGTTPRHVSFVETGRSRPGRELVLRLADALDVPLRDRNMLLTAAGLPPAFANRGFDDAALASVRQVVQRVLASHEPFPGWVIGPGYRFLSSNRAAEAVFPGLCHMDPEQLVDMWFGPGPFRALVDNWNDVVWAGIAALRREASRSGDPAMAALVERAERHAQGIPASTASTLADVPVVCPRLQVGDRTIRTISTVMRFDNAVDVTVADLRVELMFPADEQSEAFFRDTAT